jgi:triacylglycerol lipase
VTVSAFLTWFLLLGTSALVFLAGTTAVPAASVNAGNTKNECVILLHGLGRTSWSMKGLEIYFKRRGYQVVNARYPTTGLSVEQISRRYLAALLQSEPAASAAKVHFVTHSQGGIVIRQYLSNHQLDNLGRVVMLAPPNHGSEIIDHLKSVPGLRRLLGPGTLELGTTPGDLPQRLGPIRFECGVIAGDRSLNPFLSALLPGPNDSKVTVASAQADGLRDFLVLHSTHTWLTWRGRTFRQALGFLESGRFNHGAGFTPPLPGQ